MKTASKLKNLKLLSLSILTVALLILGLSSCSKKHDENENMPAHIKVTNAAQGSMSQDFYVDNTKITTVAYGSSSDFLATGAGNHQGKFVDTGATTANTSFALSLQAGKYYSVFYIDGKSNASFEDDRTMPQTGKARIRFINLSSALTSAVDFGITTGSKLTTNLAYKTASVYYDVDATAALSLYATGSSTALLSIPSTLTAGHIYTIYISGATTASVKAYVIAEN